MSTLRTGCVCCARNLHSTQELLCLPVVGVDLSENTGEVKGDRRRCLCVTAWLVPQVDELRERSQREHISARTMMMTDTHKLPDT